jgi:hypothetical protein
VSIQSTSDANQFALLALRHGTLLLERAIFNKTKTNPAPLVAAARSLLALVLKAHGLRDSCFVAQVDISDLVSLPNLVYF